MLFITMMMLLISRIFLSHIPVVYVCIWSVNKTVAKCVLELQQYGARDLIDVTAWLTCDLPDKPRGTNERLYMREIHVNCISDAFLKKYFFDKSQFSPI